VVPGEVYSVSALVRSGGSVEPQFMVRFRDSGNAVVGQFYVARDRMINGFGLAPARIPIHANTATASASIELTDSSAGYADFAEVQFRKVI